MRRVAKIVFVDSETHIIISPSVQSKMTHFPFGFVSTKKTFY